MQRQKTLKFIMPSLGLCVLLASYAYGQNQPIKPAQAGSYIAQVKTVCGKVASAKYLTRGKRQPTFLNLDQPYPNQIFTAVIWGPDRLKFEKAPEIFYAGKDVCVTGEITNYKGRAEIIVQHPSQITVR